VNLSLYQILTTGRIRTEVETSDQVRFQLPSLVLTLPIRRGLVFGIGYWSRFEGRGDVSIPQELEGGLQPYARYKRRLSLFTVPLTIAWRPLRWLSVAGELQVDRGSIKDEVANEFVEARYRTVFSNRDRYYRGISFGASMLMEAHPRVLIGGVFYSAIDYRFEDQYTYSNSEFDSLASGEFTLPPAWGIGVALGITGRWWLSSAYFSREAPEPSGFTYLDGQLTDEYLFSVGLERRAVPSGGLLSRVSLMLGYYENRWHLQFPEGSDVVGRFVTLGLRFPMPGGPGAIDLSIELGQIGSMDDNIVDERMAKFGLGLGLSEIWGRREEEKH
jgi:hypothetical protein